jgi:hypothetical protein
VANYPLQRWIVAGVARELVQIFENRPAQSIREPGLPRKRLDLVVDAEQEKIRESADFLESALGSAGLEGGREDPADQAGPH